MLLGNPSFRHFSRTVATSDLLADFCGVRRLDGIRGISKSTLERASKFFGPDQLRWMQQVLTEMCGETDRAFELGLTKPVQTDVCLIDTTCLEANIHYPVDWVALRDVATTLLKATKLIRTVGLRERTVRKWLRDGELEGSYLSDRAGWRIREGAIRDFLDARSNRANPSNSGDEAEMGKAAA